MSGSPTELQVVINQTKTWLLKQQDAQTGGWRERAGRSPSTLNTPEAILALLRAGVLPGHNQIVKGVKWLIAQQCFDEPDVGAWCRESSSGSCATPELVRTSYAVRALVAASHGPGDPATDSAVSWLVGGQRGDGSWAYGPDVPSAVLPTCMAVAALAVVCEAGATALAPKVRSGVEFLLSQRRDDATFSNDAKLQAVEVIHATLALRSAREAGVGDWSSDEASGVRWLLANPQQARRLVDETISPRLGGVADYSFLHTTDSLLIEVLAGTGERADLQRRLAADTLAGLRDKHEPSGGFYGPRVFSWSTAKTLACLTPVAQAGIDFPQLSPEVPGPAGARVQLVPLCGIGLVSVIVVALALTDKLTTGGVTILSILVLALLLVTGYLKEKTFAELWPKLSSSKGGGS